MGEEPFFPPPRPRGAAYREPSPPQIVEPSPRKVVVSRPDEPSRERIAPASTDVVAEERTYWDRYGLFTRHPRIVGGVLAALGAALTWSNVDTLLHGGTYTRRGALFAPFALCAGAWPLLFGFRREGRHPPAWWTLGYVCCCLVGFGAGLALFFALESARTQTHGL